MAKAKKTTKKAVKKVAKKTNVKKAKVKKTNVKKSPAKKVAPKAKSKKALVKRGLSSKTPKNKSKKVSSKAILKRSPKKVDSKLKAASTGKMVKAKQVSTNLKVQKILTSLNLLPLDDRILVQPLGVSDRTPGGLYIPDTANVEKPNKGTVLATGRGHLNKTGHLQPMDVKKGNVVIYGQYSGQKLNHDGTEYLILRETEVLGIEEK